MTDKNSKRRTERNIVFLFYVALFVLLCSGRGDSSDARAQLQVAMSVVYNGSFHIPAPTDCFNLWVKTAPHTYYEMHDMGATLLFLPTALLNALLSHQTAHEAIYHPGLIARSAAVFTYLILSAVGATLVYALFALFHPTPKAFLLSIVFVTTTIFWAYTKTSWDVMGGCVGIAALLYRCAELLLRLRDNKPTQPIQDGFWIAAAFCFACTFRLSLAPFFLISLLILLGIAYVTYEKEARQIPLRRAVAMFSTIALGMAPSAWYNFVRTGSPFRTAATGKFAPSLAMQGNILTGFYGLTFSPCRGIFVYAPIFVLLFFLPLIWRKIDSVMKVLITSFGLGTLLYIGAIAKMDKWTGTAGWGARYLVPVLPVLFLSSAVVLVPLWERGGIRLRGALQSLLALSFVLNLVPVLANHALLELDTPAVFADSPSLSRPEQQIVAWKALFFGLQGKPLPVPEDIEGDPLRRPSRWFPDIVAVQLWHYSRFTSTVAIVITALSGLVCLVTLCQIIGQVAYEAKPFSIHSLLKKV